MESARLIRASFFNIGSHLLSNSCTLAYLDQEATAIYAAKDGKDTKVFSAQECLANLCSHIPNRGGQMVRYYGLCKALHKPYYAEFKIMLS